NHLGITSDPLTEAQKARLPVPSDSGAATTLRQAAAPDEPLTDADDVPDPELASEDLFDLVSWAMLLAAPEPSAPTPASERGEALFREVRCDACHVPTLAGPRGLVPVYSDLLLHNMGEELADGLEMGVSKGDEFRTTPLWGITAVGPYLHDGRADTLDDAIRMHGGEATMIRDAYVALGDPERGDLLAFLESLGGAEQRTAGLLPPDAPLPAEGEPGAPIGLASAADRDLWRVGRDFFDRDTTLAEGLGPYFNGDSCRACHFDPVIGGAGPLGVNVMRHGSRDDADAFLAPDYGTIISKLSVPGLPRREATAAHNVLEPRQTPTTLGLGAIESIAEDDILALADPDDLDADGVRGVPFILGDGRLGRFGWKGSIPNVAEFVRDALSNEIGLTVPPVAGLTFGLASDDDAQVDPEVTIEQHDALIFYIQHLAPPRPAGEVAGGLELFEAVGCDLCHVPELPGSDGPVLLFSDLLLHDVAAIDYFGVPDGMADERSFRTPPLWGASTSAPYMHDGAAQTLEAAILAHDGEAAAVRAAFEALSAAEQGLLLEFLGTL
ncbi:MAG: di-heme oxidoredictase family protein, partial [Nannocystaceae bacterium]